jgi:hypothetical protein
MFRGGGDNSKVANEVKPRCGYQGREFLDQFAISITTCIVPSRQDVFIPYDSRLSGRRSRRSTASGGLAMYLAQVFELLALVGAHTHIGMHAESIDVRASLDAKGFRLLEFPLDLPRFSRGARRSAPSRRAPARRRHTAPPATKCRASRRLRRLARKRHDTVQRAAVAMHP